MSRRCGATRAISRSGSFRVVSRPTRWSASCCCSATFSPARSSRSISDDFGLLNRVLDAYEPAANRIANTVAVSFVEERERVIRQQQDALRELSTPVLQVRERLLILPIIGVLDNQRASQLTEQLLHGIRTHRAKVVVIDITGVADVDEPVANHLVKTVDASRLMGASVIITGLSSEIAQTLVMIGVDLSKMNTIGDLQGGIEEAEKLLGFEVSKTARDAEPRFDDMLVSISEARRLPDRVDPHRARRQRAAAVSAGRGRPDRPAPLPRGHHRCRRARRPGLLRVTLLAQPGPHRAASWRRDRDRRHSTRRGLRHRAARNDGRRAYGARPRLVLGVID